MTRCTRTQGLEIHYRRYNGGNGVDNAIVLCGPCHAASRVRNAPGITSLPFSQETKAAILRRAGNRCECYRMRGCHS